MTSKLYIYNKLSCIIILLCASLVMATAQSRQESPDAGKTAVLGKVRDTEKLPVPHCTMIFTQKQDSTKFFTAITDLNGDFSTALPPNEYKVEARSLGYFPAVTQLSVSGNKTVQLPQITLEASITNLNAAVVKSNTIERRADRFIVNLSANPISTGRSLFESLGYLPGVTTRNGISINGKGGTKVMVNNRTLNLSDEQLEQYLNNLRASDIQKVEVIPEAGAEYDANAAGGIIKITLKQQVESGYFGSATLSSARTIDYTQSFNPGVNFSLRKNKWSMIANGYYSLFRQPDDFVEKTNFMTTNTKVENKNITDSKVNSIGGEFSAVYDFNPKQSLGMVVNYGNSGGKINTDGTSFTASPDMVGLYTNNNHQHNDFNRISLSANFIQKLDSLGSTLTAMADYLYNVSSNGGTFDTYLSIGPPLSSIFFLDTIQYRNRIEGYGNLVTANLDLDLKVGAKSNFKAGGKYFRSQIDNDILREDYIQNNWITDVMQSDRFTYTENVSALYATYSSSWKKFLYTVGLRGEYTQVNLHSYQHDGETDQKYFDLFPTINLSFSENASKGHTLALSANRKIRRPGFAALRPYIIPLNDFSFVVGNPNLKPAKSIGLALTQTLFHKYVIVVGASFDQDHFTQIVTPAPENPNILYYQTMNINKHDQYIAALYAPISVYKWWNVNVNAIGLYIKDEYPMNNKVEVNQSTSLILNLVSNFTLPKGWRPEISGSYINGIVQGNMTVGDIYMLNAGCSKSFWKDKISATVRFDNIIYSKMDIVTKESTYEKNIVNNMDKRALYISLRYNFNSGKKVNVKKVNIGSAEEKSRL